MIWALHGAFGSFQDWAPFKSELNLPVEAADLWQEKYDLPFWEFAEKFNSEVAAKDQNPCILGYSMGGRLALHCLIAAPELWKAAVIVSASSGIDVEERSARRKNDNVWVEKFSNLSPQEFIREWNSQPVLGSSSATVTPENAKELLNPSMARGLRQWSVSQQSLLALEKIECPTLMMAGSEDLKYKNIAENMKARINLSSLHILDCGHRLPWDKPKEFSKALNSFLQSKL